MIKLFRNKDLMFSLSIQLVLTTLFLVLFTRDINQFLWALIFSLSILFTNLYFYTLRYKNISELNNYLRQIQFESTESSIPFDQLLEGELAVLKNELYKLNITRFQQQQWLLKEKQQMAQSLSDISHQLKTPLTSLILLLDLLNETSQSDEKYQEILLQARRQAHKMKLLVLVLLKMAKLQSGAIKLIKTSVSVNDLIAQSIEPLTILQDIHNVQIHQDVSLDYLMCDFTWTAEAITNILKNAIEHSYPNSTINIEVNKDTLGYCLNFTNIGENMSSKQLESIFDRFYKLPNGKPDSIGIGLSFAKQIIERQHGYIRATCLHNQTTFSIHLPFYSNESPNSHF